MIDLVWIGTFADPDYVVPMDELKQKFPAVFDPVAIITGCQIG